MGSSGRYKTNRFRLQLLRVNRHNLNQIQRNPKKKCVPPRNESIHPEIKIIHLKIIPILFFLDDGYVIIKKKINLAFE